MIDKDVYMEESNIKACFNMFCKNDKDKIEYDDLKDVLTESDNNYYSN